MHLGFVLWANCKLSASFDLGLEEGLGEVRHRHPCQFAYLLSHSIVWQESLVRVPLLFELEVTEMQHGRHHSENSWEEEGEGEDRREGGRREHKGRWEEGRRGGGTNTVKQGTISQLLTHTCRTVFEAHHSALPPACPWCSWPPQCRQTHSYH